MKARSTHHPALVICDIDFADDIVLISNTSDQAQERLLRVEAATRQIGLRINVNKTEYTVIQPG